MAARVSKKHKDCIAKKEEIEWKFGVDLGEINLEFESLSDRENDDGSSCVGLFEKFGSEICIEKSLRGLKVISVFCHEIAHLFFSRYHIPGELMTNFKSHARSGLSKEEFKSRLLDWARTDGYATAYAPTNREEDFCETFELFVMNGYKISGLERALDKDLTLKKKLRAIRELMKLGRAGRLKLRRDRRYRTDQPLVVEESPYIYGFPTLMIEESPYIYGFPTKPERDPDFNRYIAKSNEAQVQLAKASHLKQDSQ